MSLRSDVDSLLHSTPSICASVAVPSIKTVKKKVISSLDGGADLVEIRLDHIKTIDMNLMKAQMIEVEEKLILTCRRRDEGGQFIGRENERLEILSEMMDWKGPMKDIELRTVLDHPELFKNQRDLIISWHDLKRTPRRELLMEKIRLARKFGMIVKIVTMATDFEDNARLLSLYKDQERGSLIAFCMGEKGLISRILAPTLGSPFTFAYSGRNAVAPGQLRLQELRDLYGIMSIGT